MNLSRQCREAHIDVDITAEQPLLHSVRVPLTLFQRNAMASDRSEGIGWVMMAFVLMSDQVGYGLLSIPSVYRNLGYVGASSAVVIVACLTTYTGVLLARLRNENPDIESYKWLFEKNFGKAGARYASVCVNAMLFFVICSSVLVQAQAWRSLVPTICSVYWVVVAAISSILVLQIRKLPNIGVLSALNCLIVLIPNILTLYSLRSYTSSKSKARGNIYQFPTNTVDAVVSILDLMFAFSGHVVFFELIREMYQPQDFTKSLIASQACSAAVFLFNGLFTYMNAGDAKWMHSPATLSLEPGPIRTVCDTSIVIYCSLAMVVDGTVFIRHSQKSLQRWIRPADPPLETVTKSICMDINEVESPVGVESGSATPNFIISLSSNTDPPPEERKHGIRDRLEWFTVCVLVLACACILTIAIGSLNDLLGIIAALVASQTSLSWPAFLTYWSMSRSTLPVDAKEQSMGLETPRFRHVFQYWKYMLLVLCGFIACTVGFWFNVIDVTERYGAGMANPFRCGDDAIPIVRRIYV